MNNDNDNDNDKANTQNSNTEHESTETPQSKRRPPDLNTINLRTIVTYGSEILYSKTIEYNETPWYEYQWITKRG